MYNACLWLWRKDRPWGRHAQPRTAMCFIVESYHWPAPHFHLRLGWWLGTPVWPMVGSGGYNAMPSLDGWFWMNICGGFLNWWLPKTTGSNTIKIYRIIGWFWGTRILGNLHMAIIDNLPNMCFLHTIEDWQSVQFIDLTDLKRNPLPHTQTQTQVTIEVVTRIVSVCHEPTPKGLPDYFVLLTVLLCGRFYRNLSALRWNIQVWCFLQISPEPM